MFGVNSIQQRLMLSKNPALCMRADEGSVGYRAIEHSNSKDGRPQGCEGEDRLRQSEASEISGQTGRTHTKQADAEWKEKDKRERRWRERDGDWWRTKDRRSHTCEGGGEGQASKRSIICLGGWWCRRGELRRPRSAPIAAD